MGANIHPTAVIEHTVELGAGVEIGPFAFLGGAVRVGAGTRIHHHASVEGNTVLGEGCEVFPYCSIGAKSQDMKFKGGNPGVRIGDHNVFREHVTINRAMKPDAVTRVGHRNYVMVGAHFGHDTTVGNHCIFANASLLGGHVTVEDRAFLSGAVAVHQFCRVGRLAMVGGHARVVQDVPPYMLMDGQTGCIVGLNIVGLRRSGHSAEDITELKAAYRAVYRRGLPWREVLEALRREFGGETVANLREFLSSGSRGFAQERRAPPTPTLRLRIPDEETATVRAKAG